MVDLKNKTALITGGGRGIGKEIALSLARTGCDVAVCDIDLETAQAAAREIQACGVRSLALKADVASEVEVSACFSEFLNVFKQLDILVNNAGVTRDGLIMRMKESDWDLVLSVNLKSAFLCCKEAAKVMIKSRSGKIVNIASVVGQIGNAGQANYAASKSGLIGLTKTLAREFANRNIQVNAVAPGFIQTAMTDKLSDSAKEKLIGQIPMGKLGQPADVANAVLFLTSGMSDYITGHVVSVNGGMAM